MKEEIILNITAILNKLTSIPAGEQIYRKEINLLFSILEELKNK